MAVKDTEEENEAPYQEECLKREKGGGGRWGIVRKKRGEDGRRWTGTKPLGGGRGESTPSRSRMKKRGNRRKETIKICPLSACIFCSHKYKLKNFNLFAGLRTPVHSHTR